MALGIKFQTMGPLGFSYSTYNALLFIHLFVVAV